MTGATDRILWAFIFCAVLAGMGQAAEQRAAVTISGGHETARGDGGRPVVLVAGALEVAPEVFREAFSGVTPSRRGPPTGAEARRNKAALLKVLAPHGVTNDRLDDVSDYYRYRPQDGELWPTTPAQAYAVVEGGRVKQVVVTAGGAGYSSPPRIEVEGFPNLKFDATLAFNTDFEKNGSITAITFATPKKSTKRK